MAHLKAKTSRISVPCQKVFRRVPIKGHDYGVGTDINDFNPR